jgi:hypothetical protein
LKLARYVHWALNYLETGYCSRPCFSVFAHPHSEISTPNCKILPTYAILIPMGNKDARHREKKKPKKEAPKLVPGRFVPPPAPKREYTPPAPPPADKPAN